MFGQNDDENDPKKSLGGAWQHPGQPIENTVAPSAAPVSPAEPPAASAPMITLPPVSDGAPRAKALHDNDNDNATEINKNDLIDIKQKALTQLNPLMDHLDQTPEEKFRTTMMLIQASDDQALVKIAYEAAQKISNEKAKAQALLDIVNEINYFTQHHD